MPKTKVRFPIGFREGENVATPHGTVTIGANRVTELTEAQHDHFVENYEGMFDDVDETLTTEEQIATKLTLEAEQGKAATTAYQVPAIPPHEDYENAATAREVMGKATRAAVPHLTAAVQAAAQKDAEDRANPDAPIEQTGMSSVDLGIGVPVHAQSAALREQAVRRKGRDVWENDGNPRPLSKRADERTDADRETLNDGPPAPPSDPIKVADLSEAATGAAAAGGSGRPFAADASAAAAGAAGTDGGTPAGADGTQTGT